MVGADDPIPPCDRVVPLSALAHALHGDAGPPAAEIPYLTADPERIAAWRRRLTGAGPAVGLVWAGNRANARDRARSIPFALLDDLFKCPGVRFYSLQTGWRGDEVLDQPSCRSLAPAPG